MTDANGVLAAAYDPTNRRFRTVLVPGPAGATVTPQTPDANGAWSTGFDGVNALRVVTV